MLKSFLLAGFGPILRIHITVLNRAQHTHRPVGLLWGVVMYSAGDRSTTTGLFSSTLT